MQLNPPLMAVTHPEHVVAVGIEPGEGQCLEMVHDLALPGFARGVLSGEGNDPGAVAPDMRAGIDQRLGAVGIAAKHLG